MIDGVHTIPAAAYHDDPAEQPSLSASIAAILCTSSAAHARAAHPRLNAQLERREEQRFDVGTACHALLLQGETVVRVVYADDWRKKEAQELRDQVRAVGLVPLLEKDWLRVVDMAAAVREQIGAVDCAPPLLVDGKPEQTLIWREGDVTCRARLDWLHDDYTAIDDVKTTSRSANPEAWSRTLFNIGADIQAAFYRRGVKVLTGVDPEFRFVVVETAPPYALSVVSLAPSALEIANAKVDYAIARWERCLASGSWPAYPARVAYAQIPAYEEVRWLEREAREEMAA